ncbi:calreticulin family protein [Loa loa]|uniref:Calreticulin n=1 Tax=Loa loa TaxID=7209 RepID=A0A1S0TW52_LOALO|nr:calreticulin family protein [Loa loa]EFO21160.2 calreticulin family protein [Loa loa]
MKVNDGDGWKRRWVPSEYRKDYGKFNLSYGQFYNDPEEDLGLTTTEDVKNYAISAKFPKFSNRDRLLIIQYAIKRFTLPYDDCGGLYVKLMKSDLDQKRFSGETPYEIMFGPDICGIYLKKIHAIFRYKDSYYHCNSFLPITSDELSHVYTMILYPNNSIKILADYEEKITGDLEDHYDFLKPRRIMDPSVNKPADWVDEEFIPDPDDKKPDDWDQPEFILNLEVKKPDDWDDEWDGEWEPPGMINPDYKGKWVPKEIANPAYKGEWIHPEIDNPNYIPDPNLYLYDDIGAIGIEIWQVNSSTVYDNIIITDSIEEAKKFAALTLNGTRKGEEKMKKEYDEKLQREEEKKKEEEENSNEKQEVKETGLSREHGKEGTEKKDEEKESGSDNSQKERGLEMEKLRKGGEGELKEGKEEPERNPNKYVDESEGWEDDSKEEKLEKEEL